ncbi:MAG: hypothetical protein RR370_01945 [Synergistaceae bacterium]
MNNFKKANYDRLVSAKIGQKYSLSNENKILREAFAFEYKEQFYEYSNYVEACKAEAYKEVYGNDLLNN